VNEIPRVGTPGAVLSLPRDEVWVTWYDSVNQLPEAEVSAEHITLTPQWAGAWEHVRTEQVRAFRHLLLSAAGGNELASFYLVDHCPFWTENEQVVNMEPVWPGPVVFAPSPYAEYGGPGAGRPEFIAHTVDGGLALAREWGAVGVVFPNLTPDVLHRWAAVRPPQSAVLFDVAYSAPVGGSVEAFLASIPSSHVRREFRRQWRRGRDAGLTIRILPGVEMLEILADFTALTVSTSQSHGYNMYGPDLFDAVARVPGAVMIAAEHSGDLVGGFLCLRYGERMSAWTAGIDYERIRELHTYGCLTYETVAYAADTGAKIIDMGRSNHAYKQRLGLRGVDLYACVYLTEPDPVLLGTLARLHRRLVARNHADWRL
jgi:hypothetical protein